MAVAGDPYAAVERIRHEVPDVITLDVEMPRMDGLTFLEKIMSQHPIPVVICSTLTGTGSDVAMAALQKGAVDIITKPKLGAKEFFEEARVRICDVVKSAACARIRNRKPAVPSVAPKLTADAVLPKPPSQAMIETTDKVVVVGASTGGTEALCQFLQALPLDAPGIVVVQHMPEVFTARFAERLNSICRITVKGSRRPGVGSARSGPDRSRQSSPAAQAQRRALLCRSARGTAVSRHRPSVDVLFRSAARYAGANAVGVIMTGMGDDGAKGMREMKDAGAYNIAQDEATCVVYGMPAEAVKLSAVHRIMPLGQIASEVVRLCHQ